MVLEKTLRSLLDFKGIKPINPKEINPEYSLDGLMLKLKLQYFGHLMWRADSLGKDPDAGKDWRQEEKGTTENEMVGWHHRLNGHGFEQALGGGEGQGSRSRKELDRTEWLNNNSCVTHCCFRCVVSFMCQLGSAIVTTYLAKHQHRCCSEGIFRWDLHLNRRL